MFIDFQNSFTARFSRKFCTHVCIKDTDADVTTWWCLQLPMLQEQPYSLTSSCPSSSPAFAAVNHIWHSNVTSLALLAGRQEGHLAWKNPRHLSQKVLFLEHVEPANQVHLETTIKMEVVVFSYFVSEARILLPSSRHYLSYNDCLKDNRKNYQNCSVLRWVRQLWTIINDMYAHTWAVLKDECWFKV